MVIGENQDCLEVGHEEGVVGGYVCQTREAPASKLVKSHGQLKTKGPHRVGLRQRSTEVNSGHDERRREDRGKELSRNFKLYFHKEFMRFCLIKKMKNYKIFNFALVKWTFSDKVKGNQPQTM